MNCGRLLSDIWAGVQDEIWPDRCLACLSIISRHAFAELPFCAACSVSIHPCERICSRCAFPRAVGEPHVCPAEPPPGKSFSAFGFYGGQLAVAIRRMKFLREADLARGLGALLSAQAARLRPYVDICVPVPLHPRSLRVRGFNQSALLAQGINAGRLPIVYNALRRLHGGAQQSALGSGERLSNVANDFFANTSAVERQRVVLIDDVLTTGATARACVAALHAAGAISVHVLTLAYTPFRKAL